MEDITTTTPEPQAEAKRKPGRPPSNPIASGERRMTDGVRVYQSRKGPRYQVRVNALDPTTHKTRSVWKTFRTIAEARAERSRLNVDREEGRLVFGSSTTVAEWATSRAEGCQKKATSKRRYLQYAERVGNHFGDLKLQALSARSIERFRDALTAEGLAVSTRLGVLTWFNGTLKNAVGQKVLKSNPFAGVELPKPPEKGESGKKDTLSAADIADLLEILRDEEEFWLPTALLAYTGLRRGEMLAVQWRHINLDAATLKVEGTVQALSDGLVIGPPKTKRSLRTIALNASLVAELRSHKARQAELGLQLGSPQTDEWFVFPVAAKFTTPRNPAVFGVGLKWRLRNTRFKELTPHCLRHSHASLLLRARLSIKLVAARLGDTELEVLRTYAHLLEGDAASAAQEFAAQIEAVAKCGKNLPGAPVEGAEPPAKLLLLNTIGR